MRTAARPPPQPRQCPGSYDMYRKINALLDNSLDLSSLASLPVSADSPNGMSHHIISIIYLSSYCNLFCPDVHFVTTVRLSMVEIEKDSLMVIIIINGDHHHHHGVIVIVIVDHHHHHYSLLCATCLSSIYPDQDMSSIYLSRHFIDSTSIRWMTCIGIPMDDMSG